MGRKKTPRLKKSMLEDSLRRLFEGDAGKSFTLKDISRILRLATHPSRRICMDLLEAMVADKELTVEGSPPRYSLNRRGDQTADGTFIRKNDGKNAFLPDSGEEPVFVAERNSMFAMSGDRVRVIFLARRQGQRKEGVVIEILRRGRDTFVGRLKVEDSVAFLITDSDTFVQDILIPKKKLKGGKDGDKAVVRVTKWPTKEDRHILGEVTDILGQSGENNAEMHAILCKFSLPYKYPKRVDDACAALDMTITSDDMAGREDYRDVFTCTIDPADAKDFDDALSIRASGALWEVGVHIADVTHYVKENGIIDKEARRRATSVYLVDRTVPMLPERLSNDVCSLRPNEDKLCRSVVFLLDGDATVRSWKLLHTVIRSDRRFTYEEVQDILSAGKGEYSAELLTLDALAKKLRAERRKNGSVMFDRKELHFDVDDKGHPLRCYSKTSQDSNKLIEEFMLLANRTVARSVGQPGKGTKAKTLPYRVHDMPDQDRLKELRELAVHLGYKMKTGGTRNAISRSLDALLEECRGKAEQDILETAALRAMKKAVYSTDNIGHFGLAFNYYTHFTSPIRRYPDIIVHRLLTRYAAGGRSADKRRCEELCRHCSDMEQTAARAERDSIKYKMVEYMSDKIGMTFDAHISGVTSYGIYCEIDSNHCEGMVPLRELDDDYYDFDEKSFSLLGRHRHRRYRLGDAARVKVTRADIEKRQLDFTIDRGGGKTKGKD